MATRYSIRSISMPTKSHPTTSGVQNKLSNLETFDFSSVSNSGSICSVLANLEDLYFSIDELLNMSSTQKLLVSNSHHVEDLLDGSVKFLDVCAVLRDLMGQFKDCVQSLQSALRRRKGKGDSSIESSVANYNSFRKKLNKEAKKLVAALKQTRGRQSLDSDDPCLAGVIRISVSAFRSVSVFLSGPKVNKRPLIVKLMQKGSVACEEKVSELVSVDCALSGLCRSGEKVEVAQKRLGDLEMSIEGIENGLERLFRRLIKTRTSLLNIISH